MLIQTALPEHYAIQAALAHDYVAFVTRELKERRHPAYPPMVRLVNVVVSSPNPEDAASNAEAAARWLRTHVVSGFPVDLIGPAPSPIERLHGRWRWHFLLRSTSARALGHTARRLQSEFRMRGTDVRIAIDRDPSALL